jgi:Pyridoxamine 5'-phosphate oxidase/IclR helix-turn-helix domain
LLNKSPPGVRRYQDQVPAVARAVRVLELLAASESARSLADLGRKLGVGPSSLLAILTTLRRSGLVSRTPAGLYQVGPGLVALGAAAACKLRACEQFAAVADQLVAATGETVLLWLRQDDAFVLAATREGTQPLRYIPTPGLRLPAAETRLASLLRDTAAAAPGVAGSNRVDVVEDELLGGIWIVAAALPAGQGERACVALAGPRDRLVGPAIRAALVAACQSPLDASATRVGHRSNIVAAGEGFASRSEGTVASEDRGRERNPRIETRPGAASELSATAASGPIDVAELNAFLEQSLVATLSYLADDGYPATVPLWYAWDGTAFWLVSRPGSEWAEHVRLDPRVSLAVSESSPPFRRVLARGRLVEVDDAGGARWGEVERQLAARYAGFDAAREPAAAGRGHLFELKPERLIAWRGLLRHPKLPPGPETPGPATWRQLG